jgi:uncharacterized membrane protein
MGGVEYSDEYKTVVRTDENYLYASHQQVSLVVVGVVVVPVLAVMVDVVAGVVVGVVAAVEAIGVVFAVMGLIGGAVDEGAHCLNKSHQTMNWPRKDYVGQ